MITQELIDYISIQRQSGQSESSIRQALINNGWAEDDVSAAFAGETSTSAQPTPTPNTANTSGSENTMTRDEAIASVKQMGRFKASWRLFKQSLNILKQDKEIILFPVISSLLLMIAGAIFGVGMWLSGALAQEENDLLFYVALFAYYVIAYFIITYFKVGLTAIVYERINGGNIGFSEGMNRAKNISGKIFIWSLLASTVGVVLQFISNRSKLLGKLAAGLLGAAWAIVTMFIAPTLLLDNVSVWQSVKNSGSVFKKTWGETIIMNLSLGLVTIVLFLGTVVAHGLLLFLSASLGLGIITYVIILVLFFLSAIVLSVVTSTLSEIFKVALYSYARFGIVAEGFSPELILGAVKEKKEKKK